MAGKAKPDNVKSKYERCLTAFRQFPDNVAQVSRMAKVDRRTAARALATGWPSKGLSPIKEVLAREHQKARSAMLQAQAKRKQEAVTEREAAVAQAAKVRAQEGQLVSLARAAALNAMVSNVNLASAGRALSGEVQKQILLMAEKMKAGTTTMSPTAGVNMLNRVADLQSKINNSARQAMELERLMLGEPTATVNVITTHSEMSMEEATQRVKSAQRALNGVAENGGGLTVIPGGLAAPNLGETVEPPQPLAPLESVELERENVPAMDQHDGEGGTSFTANIR